MEGYARIGTLYSLREPKGDKNLVWSVIENNSNDETSTLIVVEDCPKKGMKAKFFSAVLIIAVIITVFSGCNKPEEHVDSPSDVQTTIMNQIDKTTESSSETEISKESEITVDYSENINNYSDYISFTVDETADSTKLIFMSEGIVTDFSFLSLSITDVDEDGNVTFDTEPLYNLDLLTEEKPLEVTLTFYGDSPAYGISYKDAQGVTKNYTVTISGEDGSVILTEF